MKTKDMSPTILEKMIIMEDHHTIESTICNKIVIHPIEVQEIFDNRTINMVQVQLRE